MADESQTVDTRDLPDEEEREETSAGAAEGSTASETMEISPEEAIARTEPLSVDNPQAQGQVLGKAPKAKGRKSGFTEEELPILLPGHWVKLGRTKAVPEYVQGRIAAVLEAPRFTCGDPDCEQSARPHEHQSPDAAITVQTRDEFDATLSVTREDIEEVYQNGKPGRP